MYFCTVNAYEKIRIEQEMKAFVSKSFEKPSFCRNAEQARYYSAEWRTKIAAYELRYNFIPVWAYTLLEEYQAQENLLAEKKQTYSH